MAREKIRFHSLKDSCLYKISSKRVLARHLRTTESALKRLANNVDLYTCWEKPKKSGGTRTIEAPREDLKVIQKRIANLLQRIRPPDYLMAPVKGKSYVHNAATHLGSRSFRLLDIEDFFPSCTEKKVFWFFNKMMKCSPDVSALLASLLTRNGHLPQGSPASPILAYYAYFDMWSSIYDVARKSGYRLSIYADDITISGEVLLERHIWEIKKIIHGHGHQYSRHKERSLIERAADITGVIVTHETLLLPNRQHQKVKIAQTAYNKAKTKEQKTVLDRKLRGRLAQAKQIQQHIE